MEQTKVKRARQSELSRRVQTLSVLRLISSPFFLSVMYAAVSLSTRDRLRFA